MLTIYEAGYPRILPPHVDQVIEIRPYAIVLGCIKATGTTSTYFIDHKEIISKLSEKDKRILSSPVFCGTQLTTKKDGSKNIYPKAIDEECGFSISDAEESLSNFREIMNEQSSKVLDIGLKIGEAVIFRNMIHGRSIDLAYKDEERKVIRVYYIQSPSPKVSKIETSQIKIDDESLFLG